MKVMLCALSLLSFFCVLFCPRIRFPNLLTTFSLRILGLRCNADFLLWRFGHRTESGNGHLPSSLPSSFLPLSSSSYPSVVPSPLFPFELKVSSEFSTNFQSHSHCDVCPSVSLSFSLSLLSSLLLVLSLFGGFDATFENRRSIESSHGPHVPDCRRRWRGREGRRERGREEHGE